MFITFRQHADTRCIMPFEPGMLVDIFTPMREDFVKYFNSLHNLFPMGIDL
jgi:hypothetical protein